MAAANLKIIVDEFLTKTRVVRCKNRKCEFNTSPSSLDCQMKTVAIGEDGKCGQFKEGIETTEF